MLFFMDALDVLFLRICCLAADAAAASAGSRGASAGAATAACGEGDFLVTASFNSKYGKDLEVPKN